MNYDLCYQFINRIVLIRQTFDMNTPLTISNRIACLLQHIQYKARYLCRNNITTEVNKESLSIVRHPWALSPDEWRVKDYAAHDYPKKLLSTYCLPLYRN